MRQQLLDSSAELRSAAHELGAVLARRDGILQDLRARFRLQLETPPELEQLAQRLDRAASGGRQ